MKPLILKFSAFGPYLNQQILDFTELKDNSFFLIHGATGSGKTTILDAMCYALYGDSSGNLRDGKNMRTNQADINIATEVDFSFMIGAKIYRVLRNPEQERPKKRGGGVTLQAAESVLYEIIDEAEKVLVTGYSNVTAKIEDLLGFKSSQFRQVVLLPQGEFRKLLLANSLERQEIMQTLFKTELYKKIEEALKEKAKGKEQEIKTLLDKNNFILQELNSVDKDDLHNKLEQLNTEITATEQVNKDLLILQKRKQQILAEANLVQEQFNNLEKAQAEKQEVDKLQPKVEEYRDIFAKAQAANSLADIERQIQKLQVELKQVQKNIALEEEQLKNADENFKQAQETLAVVESKDGEIQEIIRKIIYLEDILIKLEEINVLQQEISKDQAVFMDIAGRKEALEQKNVAEEELLRETGAHLQELTELASKVEVYQQELINNKNLIDKVKLYQQQQDKLRKIKQDLAKVEAFTIKLNKEYQEEKNKVILVRENFTRGQAGLLAKNLQENSPCPVCGSLDHPQVAVSEIIISADEMKVAEEKLQELERVHDEQQKKLYDIKVEHDVLENTCQTIEIELSTNKLLLTELQEQQVVNEVSYSKAKIAVRELDVCKNKIVQLDIRLKSNNELLLTMIKDWQDAKTVVEQKVAVLNEKRKVVSPEYQDKTIVLNEKKMLEEQQVQYKNTLKKAQEDVEQFKTTITKNIVYLQKLKEEKISLEQKNNEESAEFNQRILKLGFKNIEEYSNAKKEQEFCDKLAERLKTFDERFISANDNLAKWDAVTKSLIKPELTKLRDEAELAEKNYNLAFSSLEQMKIQKTHLQKKAKELNSLGEEIAKLNNEYGVVGKLAEIANGKNNYGLTFQRFVLRALLEDVIVASNSRLKIMTRGQYLLQGTTERERKNAAGGLDIEVFDNYSGYARPVSTLSGGESFLASLALALGLADVVQAYSGGIHLDTILIDEGFGTLDPEALDIAIKALIDLQKGGRLVGIISHVPELKERINARLEVSKTKQGSKACFKVG